MLGRARVHEMTSGGSQLRTLSQDRMYTVRCICPERWAVRRRVVVAAATALAVSCAVLVAALHHGPTSTLLRSTGGRTVGPAPPPLVNITMCTQVRRQAITNVAVERLGEMHSRELLKPHSAYPPHARP